MSYTEVHPTDSKSNTSGDSTPTTMTLSTSTTHLIDDVLFGTDTWMEYTRAFGIDFGSATTIRKLLVSTVCDSSPVSWSTAPNRAKIAVYGSADNSSWTLLDQFDSPTITYTSGVNMQFELVLTSDETYRWFAVYCENYAANPRIYNGASDDFVDISEIQAYSFEIAGENTEGQGFSDTITGLSLTGYITEGQGFSDTIEGDNFKGTVTAGQGFSDTLAANYTGEPTITEGQGFSDAFVGLNLTGYITEGQGFSDSNARSFEVTKTLTEDQGFSDTIEAWNYTDLVEGKSASIIKRYYFTLTGAPDSTTDLEIPIRSFQSRLNNNKPSYLSVSVPTIEQSTEINNRSNGEMIIEVALEYDGSEIFRQEIIRADLETINTYEGATNKSIVLSGHGTRSYSSETVAISNVITRSLVSGKLQYRTGSPDLFLRPGNTVTYDSDSFTVGSITFSISIDGQYVDIVEA